MVAYNIIHGGNMKAGLISEQGLREKMDDGHFLDLNFNNKGWVFAGIYDGHFGSYAAQYTAGRLHKIFLDKILSNHSPDRAFIESYETVSSELRNQDSGTTAVTLLIKDRVIFAANAGDARAIVAGRGGRYHQLTLDHRLDNPEEKQRILAESPR